MQIDRSRFLLLTAALAASTGCTIINNNAADSGPAVDTGTPATDTGIGDTASADTGTTDGAIDGATVDADADAVSCDDMTGTISSCDTITGTGCHGGDAGPNVLDIQCASYATNYKPRVASAAVDCLAKMGSPTCEAVGLDFGSCDLTPLAAACPDPAAAAFCAKMVTDCAAADTGVASTFAVADCTARLNGLLPAARDRVAHCFVTEGACSNDTFYTLDDCIHNLTN